MCQFCVGFIAALDVYHDIKSHNFTEMVYSGTIPGRVKPKTLKIGIRSLLA